MRMSILVLAAALMGRQAGAAEPQRQKGKVEIRQQSPPPLVYHAAADDQQSLEHTNNIKPLTLETAAALAKREGSELSLDGLAEITDQQHMPSAVSAFAAAMIVSLAVPAHAVGNELSMIRDTENANDATSYRVISGESQIDTSRGTFGHHSDFLNAATTPETLAERPLGDNAGEPIDNPTEPAQANPDTSGAVQQRDGEADSSRPLTEANEDPKTDSPSPDEAPAGPSNETEKRPPPPSETNPEQAPQETKPSSDGDDAPRVVAQPQDAGESLVKLKEDLVVLADQRSKLQQEFWAVAEQILPLQVKAKQLTQTIASGEKAIREKTQLMATIQRNRQSGRMSNAIPLGAVESANASAFVTMQALSNEVGAMRTLMQPTKNELGSIQQELSQKSVRRAALTTQLVAAYERWRTLLCPVHEHVAEKAAFLKEIYGRHADIPEVGLWLAWLLYCDGHREDAISSLDSVDRVISTPVSVAVADTYWDFVYLSLVVDAGDAAATRLVRFGKAWPKHPRLAHLQAVAALNDEKWTIAKSKFTIALQRKGMERDMLLNSDAAWFFLAAPVEGLQNATLASKCIDRLQESGAGGLYNAWRASSAMAAREHDWDKATEMLEKARECSPSSVRHEIDSQMKAYMARQQYTLPSEKIPR